MRSITMKADKTKGILEELHLQIAEDLLERVQSGEATASEISIAVKFLKDNNVTVEIEESEPMINLAKTLPFTEANEA